MEPKIRVVLRVYGVGDKAQALIKALKPDDKTAPTWLNIREEVEGGDLLVHVEVEGLRLGSLRSTVDEVLEFLYAALRSIEEVSKPTLKRGAATA